MRKRLVVKFAGLMMGAIWFCVSATAWGGVDLKRLNRLNGISIYSGDGETRIVARFSKNRKLTAAPVFYEKSIQLDLKGVYVEPAKRKFIFHDSLVSSALAYQFTPTTTRLRFFLSADPRSFAKRWKMERNAERMILVLKKVAPHTVKHEPAKTAGTAPLPSTQQMPAEEAITKPSAKSLTITPAINAALHKLTEKPAPVSIAKKKKTDRDATRKLTGFLDYKEPEAPQAPGMGKMVVKMLSSLSIVLALVFAIAWVAKKYMKGQGVLLPGQGAAVIKVLATGVIGARQQVKVVDVAGKILVLGVTAENVTLLSEIGEPEDMDKLNGLVARRSKPLSRARGKKPEGAVGALINAFRIGRIRTMPGAPPALLDEKDPDTFAGKMAQAEKTGIGRGRAGKDRLSRDDLVKKVTDAIKKKNGRLRIA